jgi:hypothetical protein
VDKKNPPMLFVHRVQRRHVCNEGMSAMEIFRRRKNKKQIEDQLNNQIFNCIKEARWRKE